MTYSRMFIQTYLIPNSPNLLENMYSEIENMSIQNQSITHNYENK